jgi:single-stranded DNA-binding protein
MITTTAIGTVRNAPELKTSAKGVQYLKFTLETPANANGYTSKAQVVAFGNSAIRYSAIVHQGDLIAVSGEPKAEGFEKNGKVLGSLSISASNVTVLQSASAAQYQSQAQAIRNGNAQLYSAPAPAFDSNDEIPF